jgi:peptidyl-prolyl cis-trans isomerase SurA
LNNKMSGLGGLRKAGWRKAGALAVFAVAVAWGEGSAQIVKAPRYQGGEGSTVNAPVPVLNLPPLPAAKTPNGTVVEDVVARINDQIISRSDVERAEQNLQQEAAQQNLPPSELTAKEKDMLRDMIDQQLLLSKAKELGLNADADVIRRLDEIRKQYKMSSMDDLEKAARQQGINFEDFKAQIRDQTLTQQVVRDEVGRHLQMTQADEVKFYDEHKKEFDQPEQVQLSEILVPLPENATPAEIVQAERKANELKGQLMQGADFAALAKKSSGGPTAAQGGELGLFKRGALAKVLEDQTFDLKAGETTQPIRTRQGFVILKVTQHVAAGPAPLKQVEPQVQEAMYMQEMQPALRAYLTKLREQAYIDIQPGFVDSGASPNQTKPVFTAYAPPVVKEKKVKDKSRFVRTSANGRLSGAKKTVVASPDTTGTRTLTGAEATPMIDPKTGLAVLPAETKPVKLAANGKQKKERKEKVRFGQAPRTALSGGTEEASAPAEAAPAAGSPGAAPENTVAASSANPDVNPLDPVAAPKVKTRFAARAEEHKEKKVATISAKQQEKIAAKPGAMSTDEKATAATQAAPLGLNGDTAAKKKTKQKKEKKVKGQKQPKQQKTRLEDKKKVEPVQAAPVAPTASPLLAPTTDTGTGREKTPVTQSPVPNSTAPPTSTPGTSVPPTTLPAPGAPQQEPH